MKRSNYNSERNGNDAGLVKASSAALMMDTMLMTESVEVLSGEY